MSSVDWTVSWTFSGSPSIIVATYYVSSTSCYYSSTGTSTYEGSLISYSSIAS